MNFWIDAQLPPSLAAWLSETFGVNATALRDIGLRDAKDTEITKLIEARTPRLTLLFNAARLVGTVIMTKDSDFVDLVSRLGTPPQILWVTCGNVTNQNLRRILTLTFPDALQLLSS